MKQAKWYIIPTLIVFLFVALFNVPNLQADEELDDFSFYKVASASSGYLNTVISPSGDNSGRIHGALSNPKAHIPGNAGSFLGYYDKYVTEGGISGWVASTTDVTGIDYSHSSFIFLGTSGDNAGASKGLYGYLLYGWTLNEAGLDSTGTGLFSLILKGIIGFLFFCGFLLAEAIPVLFSLIIRLLQVLNPFQFFASASEVVRINGSPNASLIQASFGRLVDTFSLLYDSIATFSWQILFPIFLLIVVTLYLFGRRYRHRGRKRLRHLIVFVIFITMGTSFLGAVYTSMLNSLADSYKPGRTEVNDIIYSTFVDFEGWVKSNRLALPQSMYLEVDVKGSEPALNTTTLLTLRELAYKINMSSLGKPMNSLHTSGLASKWDTNNLSKSLLANNATPKFSEAYSNVFMLLKRYLGNETYLASQFESSVKGNMTLQLNTGRGADLKTLFSTIDDIDDYTKSDNVFGGSAITNNIFSNGSVMIRNIATPPFSGGASILPNASYRFSNPASPLAQNKGLTLDKGGLSTLAMYNYLTSDFSSADSMTTTSSHNIASKFSRTEHASVTIVGSGMISILWGLNALVALFAIGIIGWYYAFGTLIGGINNSLQIAFNIFPAMFGSLASIFRVISLVGVILIEIIIVIFAYAIVVDIYTGIFIGGGEMFLYQLTNFFKNDAVTDLSTYTPFASMGAGKTMMVLVISNIFSLFLQFGLIYMLMKLKNKLVHAFVEAYNAIVRVIVGGHGEHSDGSGMSPVNPTSKLAMAGAVGAGSFLGSKLAGIGKAGKKGAGQLRQKFGGEEKGEGDNDGANGSEGSQENSGQTSATTTSQGEDHQNEQNTGEQGSGTESSGSTGQQIGEEKEGQGSDINSDEGATLKNEAGEDKANDTQEQSDRDNVGIQNDTQNQNESQHEGQKGEERANNNEHKQPQVSANISNQQGMKDGDKPQNISTAPQNTSKAQQKGEENSKGVDKGSTKKAGAGETRGQQGVSTNGRSQATAGVAGASQANKASKPNKVGKGAGEGQVRESQGKTSAKNHLAGSTYKTASGTTFMTLNARSDSRQQTSDSKATSTEAKRDSEGSKNVVSEKGQGKEKRTKKQMAVAGAKLVGKGAVKATKVTVKTGAKTVGKTVKGAKALNDTVGHHAVYKHKPVNKKDVKQKPRNDKNR